ncbi:hypothetical protein ACP3V3_02480 [Vibrio sp. PNB22_3_1]
MLRNAALAIILFALIVGVGLLNHKRKEQLAIELPADVGILGKSQLSKIQSRYEQKPELQKIAIAISINMEKIRRSGLIQEVNTSETQSFLKNIECLRNVTRYTNTEIKFIYTTILTSEEEQKTFKMGLNNKTLRQSIITGEHCDSTHQS